MLRPRTPRHVLLSALLLSALVRPAVASDDTIATQISDNIQQLHLPYGTILDPVFASSDPASPGYSEVISYARAGDSALWTGHYLAAEAFRYRATGSPNALDNVWRALRGIRSLMDVTGTGVVARCLVPVNSPYAAAIQSEEGRHGIYFNSLEGVDFFWIGNTSRDQYSGVMFGLMAAYEIGDTAMRDFIRSDVTDILNYLLARGWNVVMPDGSISTTFVHRPDQILTFLQIGRRINPTRFGWVYTLYRYNYASSVGLPVFFDNLDPYNHYFKFNLNMINLYNLVRLEDNTSSYKADYVDAYDALRRTTESHGNAHFNMIDRALKGANGSRDAETISLLDLWLQRPRRDYWVDQQGKYTACDTDRACAVIPVNDRVNTDFLWQRSPFLLFGGGAGIIENNGIDYILSYWMARAGGMIQ